MPEASYMVSSISSINWRTSSSTVSTGAARVRRRSSGYSRMGNLAMALEPPLSCHFGNPPTLGGGALARNYQFGKHSVQETDRKSTRLNSSHVAISYAVFCLKKK